MYFTLTSFKQQNKQHTNSLQTICVLFSITNLKCLFCNWQFTPAQLSVTKQAQTVTNTMAGN